MFKIKNKGNQHHETTIDVQNVGGRGGQGDDLLRGNKPSGLSFEIITFLVGILALPIGSCARPCDAGAGAKESMDHLIMGMVKDGWRMVFMNDDYSIWTKEAKTVEEWEHNNTLQEMINASDSSSYFETATTSEFWREDPQD